MMLQHFPSAWTNHESVLRPSSVPAHSVYGLWQFMIWVSAIVYVLVIIGMLVATVRGRRRRETLAASSESTARTAVTLCGAVTIAVLFGFLIYDFGVGSAVAAPLDSPTALRINLIGHQWWWEVQYVDTAPSRRLTTANEIHVPTGRPVLLTLTSTDVIHSFWMPNLNGKKDLIPGHVNDAWFQVDTPGVYRGQCAEYCGLEHAKMALLVVAQRPADFNKWYDAQLTDAAEPSDSVRALGKRVFVSGSCAMCHSIAGTGTGAVFGPDLTHVGSRLSLAAGMIPNTPGNLGGWIADPQSIKPGANMPANALSPRDLRALIAYLEGLK